MLATGAERLSNARALGERRQYDAALAELEPISEGDEAFQEALRLGARLQAERRDWTAAEASMRRAIALGGETLEDLRLLAMATRRQRKLEEAATLFRQLLGSGGGEQDLSDTAFELNYCLYGLGRLPEAEQVLRDAVARRPEGRLYTELAKNLSAQNRTEEAAAAATAAIALDPGQIRARSFLNVWKRASTVSPHRRALARWPARSSDFLDARRVIVDSLLAGYPDGDPFITDDAQFITLGSCFAENLAARLRDGGRKVFSETIGEEVNSTYANRFFLKWIEQGAVCDTTRLMEEAYGEDLRIRYLEAFRTCDVFIFTLGVAPCFFDAVTGEFFFMHSVGGLSLNFLLKNYVMRTTTVEENAANLQLVIEAVRRISRNDPHIVLTVSPVPLQATAERKSAVIADCLSKSTLRLACEQALTQDQSGRVHYWPSFEIVRWLGPHFAGLHPPVYGAVDSKTRHVSHWIIDLIIDLFLETYAVEADAPVAPAVGSADLLEHPPG